MEATHRLERLRQSLVSGGCGPETEARDNPGRICSGEQAEAFVPSDAVGPADVGISCKPAIPTTLGIQNGHRRAVEAWQRPSPLPIASAARYKATSSMSPT